jgi:hypothetical protein
MSEYIFYYELSDGTVKAFNYTTNKFYNMSMSNLYKQKTHYHMFMDYDQSRQGLKLFAKEFFEWVKDLKSNKIFRFNYLKYKSHEMASTEMFKKLCHGKFENMEDIDSIEFEFIEACNNAGLRYCKEGKFQSYGYDYKSQYPSILASEGFEIPKCKGILSTIKQLDFKKLEVGYYKVIISSSDERFNKVFAYSKKHVYTHISLFYAYQCMTKENYNVKIELIEENDNCYLYGKNKKDNIVKGSIVFGKWYKHLFELKEYFPKNKLVKFMTSAIWGRLAQFHRLFKTDEEIINENLDVSLEYDINHDYYIRNITQNRKGDDVYELINCKKPYYYNLARIKPFLLAKSRDMIGKVAIKYIDDVVRICVDNVTFNQQHDDVMFNSKTFKLTMENKTTGLISWRNELCYKNHTTGHETKNFKDEYLEDEDIHN